MTLLAAIAALGGCDVLGRAPLADGNRFTEKESRLERMTLDGWPTPDLGPDGRLPAVVATLVAADLDGDGDDDLLAHYDELGVVQAGLSSGGSRPGFDWLQPLPLPRSGALVAVGDLRNDGSADLLFLDGEGGRILAANVAPPGANGGGQTREMRWWLDAPVECAPGPVNAGDFDGDGRADIACRGAAPQSPFVVHPVNDDGTLGPAVVSPAACAGCLDGPWKVGDFDGDGHADIAGGDPAAIATLRVHFGDGTGRFVAHATLAPTSHVVPTAGDLDGDGRTDLVTVDGTTDQPFGELAAFIDDGQRHFAARQPVVSNINYGLDGGRLGAPRELATVVAADLDGDGRAEVALAGHDIDYGPAGPLYLRVLGWQGAAIELTSSTALTELVASVEAQHLTAVAFSVYLLAGDFRGTGPTQLLVWDARSLEYWFFQWNNESPPPA
jgi:hypothetical protein